MARALYDFHTFNPHIRFDVVNNPALTAMMTKRTLSFKFTDNDKRYDEIEWKLDNTDGAITRPEVMALGYLIRVRLGYNSFTTPWRAFIITRLQGGPGVVGRGQRPAINEESGVITLYGRNRNAPDLPIRRKKSQAGRHPIPTGRGANRRGGVKAGMPTNDVVQLEHLRREDPLYEDILDETRRRTFKVRRISDAVTEIHRRLGYPDAKLRIEPTDDIRDEVVIPAGTTTGEWLKQQQETLDWIYKIKRGVVHFHSPNWRGNRPPPPEVFRFGEFDILDFTIDTDFRLPVPPSVRARGYNPQSFRVVVTEKTSDDNSTENGVVQLHLKSINGSELFGHETRKKVLQQPLDYLEPGAPLLLAGKQAERRLRNRMMRAFLIKLKITGNPTVLATDNIALAGFGNTLLDRTWYVATAVHELDGSGEYVTTLELRPAGKKVKVGPIRSVRQIVTEKDSSGATQVWQLHVLQTNNELNLPARAHRF